MTDSAPANSAISSEAQKAALRDYILKHTSPDKLLGSFDNAFSVLKEQYSPAVGFISFNQRHFVNVFLDVLCEIAPAIETLSFGYNKISTFNGFSQLWHKLPFVKNLNFEGNFIEDFRELDFLVKISHLKEFILLKNPLTSKAGYFAEIKRKFPSLLYLDKNEILRSKTPVEMSMNQASATVHPLQDFVGIGGNFFDNNQTTTIVGQYFARFFDLFDNNRISLLDCYADCSMFSLLHRECSCAFAKPKTSSCPFNNASMLNIKGSAIIEAFNHMPQTEHDTDSMSFSCWQSQNTSHPVLNVFIRGTFEDTAGVKRLFLRSFFLVPPLLCRSESKWPAVIANEQLSILECSDAGGLSRDKFSSGAAGEHKKRLLKRFSKKTGLTIEYAEKCLSDNGWNEFKSFKAFKHLMVTFAIDFINDVVATNILGKRLISV